jgi:membrane-associated protein
VFCGTGLVALLLLPGDSPLFIGGAFAATGEMNVGLLLVVMISGSMGLVGPVMLTCGDRLAR